MTRVHTLQLGLEDLMKRAKSDIRTKLSTDNILAELFSSFTAKYVFFFHQVVVTSDTS